MATVQERVQATGESTWAVLFRHRVGSRTRQRSKTFETDKAAADFKQLVEILGPDKALATLAGDATSAGPRLTVAELAERYLEWKTRDVTDRTVRQYRRDIGNWVLPWFADRPAEALDETDVQDWVDHMATRLAPKSVADRHMLLHAMFDFGRAKSRKLVTHNPCLETQMPRRKKRPPKGTTVPEYRAILAAAADRNPDARDLVEYMGETGWRPSEAAALPARAVELRGPDVWVTVVQTFQIIENRQVLVRDEAKSAAAFRLIRLLPDSAATVRRRLAGLGPDDLVFTNSRGRLWNQNTFLRDTWPGILRAAGLYRGPHKSPTPYWLRHMHVAVMAAAGVPMHEIQRRVGHEHYSTTVDVYGSMIGDISDESLIRAAAIMAGTVKAQLVGDVVVGEIVEEVLGELEVNPG